MFKRKIHPVADGTFIQADMVMNWDDSIWEKELDYLKEVKMHYLIINTFINKNEEVRRVYKTSIKDQGFIGNRDVIDTCLRNCEKKGIKVFLGIDYDTGWWKNGSKQEQWLYDVMFHGNMAIDELYKKYKNKYPNAFYGWYWVYEVDNLNFSNLEHFEILAKAVNINLEYMERRNMRQPILISPFMNKEFSSANKYAEGWKYFFKQSKLKEKDIFCPQDSVGGGGLNIRALKTWFKALKKAVETKPGLSFWANIEVFDHKNWNSAFLKRFIKQMELEQPFVDNIITFAYSHYYSPNNVKEGFHKAYLKYIRTGKLDKNIPEPPKWFLVKKIDGENVSINWGKACDKPNIAGCKILCNGKEIFCKMTQRKYGGSGKEELNNITHRNNNRISIYEIILFDCVGNQSKSKKTIIL